MPTPIETALIAIFPDFSQFNDRLRAGLVAAATRAGALTIQARVDTSQMSRDISEATRRADKIVHIQAKLDDINFKRDLALIRNDKKVTLTADLEAAKARLELARLSRDRTVHIRAEADVARARLALLALEQQGRSSGNGIFKDLFSGFTAGFGVLRSLIPGVGGRGGFSGLSNIFSSAGEAFTDAGGGLKGLTAAAGKAGPALAALVVIIAAIVAAVASLAASLGAALIGLVAFTGVAITAAAIVGVGLIAAFYRVTSAVKAYVTAMDAARKASVTGDYTTAIANLSDYSAQFNKLTPEGKKFTSFITGTLLPSFSALSKVSEQSFLPGIQTALENLYTLAPRILTVIDAVGTKIGNLARRVSEVFSGPQGSSELNFLFDNILDTIDKLTPAVASFSQALLTILSSASPGLTSLSDWVNSIASRFNNWIQGLNSSGSLGAFFKTAADEAKLWLDLIIEASKTIFNSLAPLVPIGHLIVQALTGAFRIYNAFADTVYGSKAIFATAAVLVGALGAALLLLAIPLALIGAAFLAVGAIIVAFWEAGKKVGEWLADFLQTKPALNVAIHWAIDKLPDWAKKLLNVDDGGTTATWHDAPDRNPAYQTPTLASRLLAGERQTADQQAAGTLAAAGDKVVTAQKAAKKAADDEINNAKDVRHANEMADRAVIDSKQRLADVVKQVADRQIAAHKAVKQAVDDLAKARADAAKALEEQGDKEQSALIAMQRAQREAYALGLYKGPVVSEEQIKIEETQTGLSTATRAYNNTTAEGAILRANGIENAPAVIAAKDNLAKAQKEEKDAFTEGARQKRDAQVAVNDAIYSQKKTLDDGKQSELDAHQRTLDQNTALDTAKTNVESLVDTMIQQLYPGLDNSTQKYQALRSELLNKLEIDTSDPKAKLTDLTNMVGALELMAKDPTMTFATAYAQAKAATDAATAPVVRTGAGKGNSQNAQLATGGPIYGPGSWTSDSVPAMLSHGEYVIRAAAASKLGLPYLNQLNHADKYADGGFASRGNQSQNERQAAGADTTQAANTDIKFDGKDSYGLGSKVLPWVIAAGNVLGKMFGIKTIGGWRVADQYPDHPGGWALDFMTDNLGNPSLVNPAGDKLSTYVTQHAKDLNVLYEIWNTRSWNPNRGSWANYTGSSNPHKDHVHVSFLHGGKETFEGVGAATNITGGGSTPSGLSKDQIDGYTSAYLAGIKGTFVEPLAKYMFSSLAGTGSSSSSTGAGSPTDASVASGTKGDYQKYAQSLFGKYGWSDDQLGSLITMWNYESGWDPHNFLGEAYGIPQALPGSKMASAGADWHDNAQTQIRWGLGYIKDRYGSPNSAWAKWQERAGGPGLPHRAQGWYSDGGTVLADNGAVLPPRSATMVVNGTNQPEQVGFGFTDAQLRKLAVLIAQAVQTRPNELYIDGEVINDRAKEAISKNLRIPGL